MTYNKGETREPYILEPTRRDIGNNRTVGCTQVHQSHGKLEMKRRGSDPYDCS